MRTTASSFNFHIWAGSELETRRCGTKSAKREGKESAIWTILKRAIYCTSVAALRRLMSGAAIVGRYDGGARW